MTQIRAIGICITLQEMVLGLLILLKERLLVKLILFLLLESDGKKELALAN